MIWVCSMYICDDSTLNEKNFRTHCLELLTKLAQLTNPSIADPVPPVEAQSKLLFLDRLPQEQELAVIPVSICWWVKNLNLMVRSQ